MAGDKPKMPVRHRYDIPVSHGKPPKSVLDCSLVVVERCRCTLHRQRSWDYWGSMSVRYREGDTGPFNLKRPLSCKRASECKVRT